MQDGRSITGMKRYFKKRIGGGEGGRGRLDFATVQTPVKIYPSFFEVEAEESGWEKG